MIAESEGYMLFVPDGQMRDEEVNEGFMESAITANH